MGQPVSDTLNLSDALRETGMEREQAEGLARSLGTQLGAHVAVQSDLEAGFQGVRSALRTEIQQVVPNSGAGWMPCVARCAASTRGSPC